MALLGNACHSNARVPPELASAQGGQILVARPPNVVERILGTLFIVLLSLGGLGARGQVAEEYQLKAAIMKHFASFVEWPTNAFPSSNSPITIGVLGSDPFGQSLDKVVSGVTVGERKLDVKRYKAVEEIKICHILFISQSEEGKLYNIFANLKGRHILTVGENETFVRSGGIIGIEIEEGKPLLKINVDNADSEAIKIDSRLLSLAKRIKAKKDK